MSNFDIGFGKAFSYQQPLDIFKEHAQLSTFENQGQRNFNLAAYADLSVQD
ncbi:hypothetical protein [Candidatus Venteria ishoeyi]|uniref:hypothetical protein n=1 Tax=Candidatus Venteria ishoeyi TaxID=1899563 RepID=UPI0015AB9C8F|nr:hypothetical protein [Candidatus Venteria ishoeyi]